MDPGCARSGWTLGEDGHWKPPPFEVGGPAAAIRPSRADRSTPSSGQVPPWPPPQPGSSVKTPGWSPPRSWAVALVAVACIAAVTIARHGHRRGFESTRTPTTDAPMPTGRPDPTAPSRPTTSPPASATRR